MNFFKSRNILPPSLAPDLVCWILVSMHVSYCSNQIWKLTGRSWNCGGKQRKRTLAQMIRFCLMVFMHTMAGKKFPMLTILGEFSLGLWSHSTMAAATLQSRGWKNVAQVEKKHGICRTSHNCWWCGVSILEELPWRSTEVRVRGLVEIYIVFHANARVSSCFKFFLPDRLTALEKSNYSVGLIL